MSKQPVIELAEADIFQRDELVLSHVTFQVEEGEMVYLIGRVGTGKSSLIKTLNGEIPLVNGSGRVAGFDLTHLRNREVPMLRRKLGVVFQDFRLLSDRNVKANLEFVLKATGWKNQKAVDNRVHEVLDMVGMGPQLDRMPHRLSGGEQQRVVIARAILNDPPIILADEPTGNLDPETSELILGLLQQLHRQGKTIIMATHDYALIGKHKARTLSCDNKRVVDVTKAYGKLDFDQLL